MTTYVELEQLVTAQTKRPDIPGITKSAIRTATLRAHHVDFFPRDLVESPLTYTPSSTASFYDLQNISSTLPRMRSLKFLVGIEAGSGRRVEQLEFREIDDLYATDGTRRTSVYCLIGDTLRIYPLAATGTISAYYYQNPALTEHSFISWIVDTYPDEVAMWAAAIVFARTGNAEMAADFQRTHVQPFKELLIASHLIGNVS